MRLIRTVLAVALGTGLPNVAAGVICELEPGQEAAAGRLRVGDLAHLEGVVTGMYAGVRADRCTIRLLPAEPHERCGERVVARRREERVPVLETAPVQLQPGEGRPRAAG